MTRAGAARLLGLTDRGHLGAGAAADITVYTDQADKEKMFARDLTVINDWEIEDDGRSKILVHPCHQGARS
jgi:formylmethanofuran dehydrogenase subunit A